MTTVSAVEALKPDKLTEDNFEDWEVQIRFHLTNLALWGYVDGTITKPALAKDKANQADVDKWVTQDNKAQAAIYLSCDNKQRKKIKGCTTSKDMFDHLKDANSNRSVVNKILTETKFYGYKCKEDQTALEVFDEIERLADDLKNVGVALPDNQVIAKIIASLPTKYNHFKESWWSVESSKQTIANLRSRLKMTYALEKEAKEDVKKETEEKDTCRSFAMRARGGGRGGSRGRGRGAGGGSPSFRGRGRGGAYRGGGRGGHHGPNNRQVSNEQNKYSNVECYHCKKKGHMKRDCPELATNQNTEPKPGPSPKQETIQNNQAQNNNSTGSFMMSFANMARNEIWYCDSGSTEHVCGNLEYFSAFEEFKEPKVVVMSNNSIDHCVGVGKIDIEYYCDGEWKKGDIQNVHYIPNANNLFSERRMSKKGYYCYKDDEKLFFKHKQSNVSGPEGEVYGDMWTMRIRMLKPIQCMAAMTVKASPEIWHARFGHVNMKYIQDTIKNGAVQGIEIAEANSDFFCDDCHYGKEQQKPYYTNENRETVPGKVIWFDTAGKMPVPSIGGNEFFLLLKDEATSFQMVYFMKNKSEAPACVKSFIETMENMTGNRVSIARSDNAAEYVGKELESYFEKKGILHGTSVPRNPQMNGFIENAIKTCKNLARTMLIKSGMNEAFWAEAVNTAVYVMNRTCKKNENMTPYEKIMKKKPDLRHMKIFGSEAFVHVPDSQRKVWDPKARKGILVGYESLSNAFRVYMHDTKKTEIHRNCSFNEDHLIKSGNHVFTTPSTAMKESSFVSDNSKSEEQFIKHGMTLRPRENLRAPARYDDFVMSNMTMIPEPKTYEEAINSEYSEQWNEAIVDELTSHEKNGTWEIVDKPQNTKILSNRWVFKVKLLPDGNVDKFKARLVIRGFEQRPGIDFNEIFASVTRYESVRLLLAIAAAKDMPFEMFDFKTAFLNSKIDKEIYMQIPKGLNADRDTKACLLKKGIYGLVQAPALWYNTLKDHMQSMDFRTLIYEPSVFAHENGTFVAIYVDDGLAIAPNKELLDILLAGIKSKFAITITGNKAFIGLEISRDEEGIKLHQRKMITDLIHEYGLDNSKHASVPISPGTKFVKAEKCDEKQPYRQIIGSLLYIARLTRPDIMYAVAKLAQYTHCFNHTHFKAAKQVLRYLHGTKDDYLLLPNKRENGLTLVGYTDADYASDEDSKSISGNIFFLGDSPVSWSSNKQGIVAQSTCESEYVSLNTGAREAVWLRSFLEELNLKQEEPTPIFVDNTSAIKLSKNPEFHKRTKHIRAKFHYVRELVKDGDISVHYVHSKENKADIFTKPLHPISHRYLKRQIGIVTFGEDPAEEESYVEELDSEEGELEIENYIPENKDQPEAAMGIRVKKSWCASNFCWAVLYVMIFLLTGGLAVNIHNTVPVIWRSSNIPITHQFYEVKLQIKLFSPCDFITKQDFYEDHLGNAIKQCRDYYDRMFLDELETFCPTPNWNDHEHHILSRKPRLAFIPLLIIAAAVGGVGIVSFTALGFGIASFVKTQELEERMEKVESESQKHNKRIDELEKHVRVLEERFNETIARLNIHIEDVEDFKSKSITTNYVISYITSRLVSGSFILKQASREWKQGKVYPSLLDLLNITLPCHPDCPLEYSSTSSCQMSETRQMIYMSFRIPVINRDLVLLKPDPFHLMIRKENETCSTTFHGVKNVVLSKKLDCIMGTNVEDNYREIIVLPDEKCMEPNIDSSSSSRYFSVEKCQPKKPRDEREFIQVKVEGNLIHVYCPESTFTMFGNTEDCPNTVFTMPFNNDFKVNNQPFMVSKLDLDYNSTMDPRLSIKTNFHLKPKVNFDDLYIEPSVKDLKNDMNEHINTSNVSFILFVVFACIIALILVAGAIVYLVFYRKTQAKIEELRQETEEKLRGDQPDNE